MGPSRVERGLSPKTLDWYRMIGERFAAFRTSRGADPALSAVSVAEARAFVVSLQEAGVSPSSIAGFVRGLRAFTAWCAAEGLVAEDRLRRLPRPHVPSRLIRTLGPVELERLLAVASRRVSSVHCPLPGRHRRPAKGSNGPEPRCRGAARRQPGTVDCG